MKKMLWVIFMMSTGTSFTSPIFPLYQEQYQLSSLQITILFAMYAIFLLPSLLIVSSRGSAWGLKRVLRASILLSIIATLLFMASQQAWLVYGARLLEGIAYGCFTGTAVAFLLKQTSKEKSANAILLSGMAVSFGFGLGPALAGLIIQYLQLMPLRAPFWLLTVMLLSAGISLETLQDEELQARKERRRSAPASISLGVSNDIKPHFWSFSALPVFTLFTLNGTVLSLIPSFVKNVIHTSNLAVSGLLILLLMGGGTMMQMLPWFKHPVVRLRIGIALLACGAWLVVLSGKSESISLMWIGVLVQALGSGWTFQMSLRLAGELPNVSQRPKVISTYYFAGYIGFIVPIVGVGLLSRLFDLYVSLIVLNVLASLLVLFMLGYSVGFARYYATRNRTHALAEGLPSKAGSQVLQS
ncbi:putative MFS family arabinose efflux permease [Paenibacillus taihuensis]|uniref:Putative MFS family arabinose efflux permease n=1 Tax=Paenibacillus taihuensis TaxID=1156355 RepID=A0A3D9S6D6_9BACL|nr:MFS transporter [Paenibacillus taihuensis]REE88558.1 putative MFS family arabinose efflux permease [Paenibacillus taihuensis]